MTKDDVITKVNYLISPKGSYVVYGSATFADLGIGL
jgi:hypothetical protein